MTSALGVGVWSCRGSRRARRSPRADVLWCCPSVVADVRVGLGHRCAGRSMDRCGRSWCCSSSSVASSTAGLRPGPVPLFPRAASRARFAARLRTVRRRGRRCRAAGASCRSRPPRGITAMAWFDDPPGSWVDGSTARCARCTWTGSFVDNTGTPQARGGLPLLTLPHRQAVWTRACVRGPPLSGYGSRRTPPRSSATSHRAPTYSGFFAARGPPHPPSGSGSSARGTAAPRRPRAVGVRALVGLQHVVDVELPVAAAQRRRRRRPAGQRRRSVPRR